MASTIVREKYACQSKNALLNQNEDTKRKSHAFLWLSGFRQYDEFGTFRYLAGKNRMQYLIQIIKAGTPNPTVSIEAVNDDRDSQPLASPLPLKCDAILSGSCWWLLITPETSIAAQTIRMIAEMVFILLSNVQAHPRLPVARLLPGAKRPSRRRDAGSRWVQRLVSHFSYP